MLGVDAERTKEATYIRTLAYLKLPTGAKKVQSKIKQDDVAMNQTVVQTCLHVHT